MAAAARGVDVIVNGLKPPNYKNWETALSAIIAGVINAAINHAWAYLPDLARAAVMLAQIRAELAIFEDVPFGGHTLRGSQIMAQFEIITGQKLALKKFPWGFFYIAAPFWRLGRELLEMRYLWDIGHGLDNSRLQELLPEFEATPLETVLRASIGKV